jgi:hypothetical protein
MNHRYKFAAAFALAAALLGRADVKVNENLTVSGYAVGSYRILDSDPGTSTDRIDLDAVKTLFTTNFKPVTGVISLYYQPGAPSDVTILDAYATLDIGGGSTITAGKFLSYLGYEAFDIPNMTQMSYANGDFLAPIPGYHTGVKWDYAASNIGVGLAVVDSVYSGPNYLKGDGEFRHNGGFEGYFTFKADALQVWTGFAYDTKGNVIHKDDEIFTWDLWASYSLSASTTVAAEYAIKDGGLGDKGYNWLTFLNHAFGSHFSSAFRISGEQLDDGGPGFTKFTVSPAYKVNENFLLRTEYSYYDYKNHTADSASFFGVQGVFRF